MLLITMVVQLGAIAVSPEASAFLYGFPFPFVSLTIPDAQQSMVFFAALGQKAASWALYPLSLLVDVGIWFVLYFLAAAVVLPLLHRK